MIRALQSDRVFAVDCQPQPGGLLAKVLFIKNGDVLGQVVSLVNRDDLSKFYKVRLPNSVPDPFLKSGYLLEIV